MENNVSVPVIRVRHLLTQAHEIICLCVWKIDAETSSA